MQTRPETLILRFLYSILIITLMSIPALAIESNLSPQDFLLTIDETPLSDGDIHQVLAKDIGITVRLNVYIYHTELQSPVEIRLYKGNYTSASDYSEITPITTYLLSDQTEAGFNLTKNTSFTKGEYTLAIFADKNSVTPIMAVIISISRPVVSEVITSTPTCIHPGTKLITYEDDGDPTTADFETVSIDPIGHIWSSWEHLAESHRHTRLCTRETCGMRETNSCEYDGGVCKTCRGNEGHRHALTHILPDDPTCTETGIKEHYICDCGKKFRDQEATKEITDTDSLTIPALDHSYGSWSFNSEDHTHTRICLRDLSHRETKACVFDSGSVSDHSIVYTCTICRGTYTENVYEGHALRIYGKDRYETAFLVADSLKQSLGIEKFQAIVVASGLDFADALSGSYLANCKNAPILPVSKTTINKVSDYILENLAPGGTVYILGGPNAVPVTMEEKLISVNVKRLQGATRYETNLAILNEAGTEGNEILVCTGLNFADGLSASAVNRPILLVRNSLTAEQKTFLEGIDNAKIYIIGGEAAVSLRTENELNEFGSVERIYGANRYETSVNIAKEFFPNAKYAVLAYGQNFPDGLSGGPLAKNMNAPLLLSYNTRSDYAKAYAESIGIRSGVVLGGSGLISDKSVNTIFALGNQKIIVTTR